MVDQNKLAAETEAVFKSSRNDVDPVSGNEVPTGSLPEEVRDDIPAQLSEGEYVVPADVVRYYGVKFFEDLRSEAKMGWQNMEQNGRVGGEPMSPEGMEMGGDELPFDISELQFVDVPDEEVQAYEGKYINGYADGGFLDSIKDTLSHIWSNDNAKKPSKTGSKSWEGGKGDAIGGGRKWQSGNKSEDKEPDVEVGKTFGSLQERAKQMYGARQAYRGYADGGYALSEGDVGYEEQGSLGFGTEGIGLGGGVVMRLYRNDAGEEMEIPFLNGEPQIEIPDGYYPVSASETVLPSEDTTVTGGSGGGGGGAAPQQPQRVDLRGLSLSELQAMVEEQQSYKGDAIAAGLGLLNPLMGLAVKFAMWDQSKQVEAELERRAGMEGLSPEDRKAIQDTLTIAKKDKPKLMQRIFGVVKDKVLDVVDPQEPLSMGPQTRAKRNPLTGSAVPPTSEGIPEPSPITVETLPAAGTEDIVDIASKAIESPYTGYKAPSSEKFNTAGQGDSPTPLTDAFGTGNVFTSGPRQGYKPSKPEPEKTDFSKMASDATKRTEDIARQAESNLASQAEVDAIRSEGRRVSESLKDRSRGVKRGFSGGGEVYRPLGYTEEQVKQDKVVNRTKKAVSLGDETPVGRQYAGEGFEWIKNPGTNAITRRRTDRNKTEK